MRRIHNRSLPTPPETRAKPGRAEGKADPAAGASASEGAAPAQDSRPSPPRDVRQSAPRDGGGPKASIHDGRALRFVFYAVLFALAFGLAVFSVWLLTPGPNDVTAGELRVFIGGQQIPSVIVLFTVFAMLLWRFRHDLPFAAAIGVGGRRDVPQNARERFEDAAILLEEAHRILRNKKRDIGRELTTGERETVEQSLSVLEKTMTVERFDLEAFDAAHAKADKAVAEHLGRWRKGEMREYAESIGIAVAVALLLRAFVVEAFKIPSGSMIPTLVVGDHIFVNKFTYGPLVPWTESRLWTRLPPSRGDVMVFKYPENPEQDFIKRAIAIPGDTLEVADGRPVINGWLVPNCYVGPFKSEHGLANLYVEYLEDKSFFTLFESRACKRGDECGGGNSCVAGVCRPDHAACDSSDDCTVGTQCKAGICASDVTTPPFHVREGEAWVMGDNRNNSHDSRFWRNRAGAGVPFQNIKGRAMFVWFSMSPAGALQRDRFFVNVMGRPTLPGVVDPPLKAALDKCLASRPPVAQTMPPAAPPPAAPARKPR